MKIKTMISIKQFSQYPEDYPDFKEEVIAFKETKKGIYVLAALILFIIIIGSLFIFRGKSSEKPEVITTTLLAQYCGNRVCEANENCYDCPSDCPCPDDRYCDPNTKTCVSKGFCGDGKCDLYESKENCCVDCGCWYATQVCNRTTMSCEWLKMNLSNEDATRFVREYVEKEGIAIKDIRVTGEYGDDEKMYKTVVVEIEGEEWPRYFRVDEKGNVEEIYPI
ncbi:MAG: hypothetical protein QXU71_03765 [Candidatus Aenigmatarchaeota archaeon]